MPRVRRQHEVERGLLAAVVARHPREFVGSVMAASAALAILVNALFLQHGPHPAPIFAPRVSAGPVRALKEDRLAVAHPAAAPLPAHKDPIAELIDPSKPHMLAIQHALAEFGYGQIKPTGVLDRDTRATIEKFERERGLPVDGQVTDRFTHELGRMTGRPLE